MDVTVSVVDTGTQDLSPTSLIVSTMSNAWGIKVWGMSQTRPETIGVSASISPVSQEINIRTHNDYELARHQCFQTVNLFSSDSVVVSLHPFNRGFN